MIPSDSPNAFATGRNPQHASVAVTHGILNLLTDEELEGVLAHELGHVRNRDILTSSVAATIAGAITILARMAFWFGAMSGMGGGDRRDREGGGLGALFMLIFAPFAAMLIQLWVSRTREYEADHTGAELTGNPYALASALEKIDAYSKRLPLVASPTTAHLFIVQPLLSGQTFASLFSTHPPIQKRIERLSWTAARLREQGIRNRRPSTSLRGASAWSSANVFLSTPPGKGCSLIPVLCLYEDRSTHAALSRSDCLAGRGNLLSGGRRHYLYDPA